MRLARNRAVSCWIARLVHHAKSWMVRRVPLSQALVDTFACRWLERGGSLAALRQIFGHSFIVTTQRHVRISDDMVRREAERVGAVGGANGPA